MLRCWQNARPPRCELVSTIGMLGEIRRKRRQIKRSAVWKHIANRQTMIKKRLLGGIGRRATRETEAFVVVDSGVCPGVASSRTGRGRNVVETECSMEFEPPEADHTERTFAIAFDDAQLLACATQFALGVYPIPTLPRSAPVWLERRNTHWIIRAEIPGTRNPQYLAVDVVWRYKCGTWFISRNRAVEVFNAFLATLKPACENTDTGGYARLDGRKAA